MKSLTSWLLIFFMIMFWGFRIVLTLCTQTGGQFGDFIVFDNTTEIILLFASIIAFILILKRNIVGAILYVVGYGYYFGTYIIGTAIPVLTTSEMNDVAVLENTLVCALGLIMGICTVFNILFEKSINRGYSDGKTDWYFKEEKYDRKLDERADKNQYKF